MSEVRFLKNFPLPPTGAGGSVKYEFAKLSIGGDPLFVPFNSEKPKNRQIACVRNSARCWAKNHSDTTRVAGRVVKDPSTGEEGIAIWRVA